MLHSEFKTGSITRAELASILNGTDISVEKKKSNKDLTTTMEFLAEYEKNPAAFLRKHGSKKMTSIYNIT